MKLRFIPTALAILPAAALLQAELAHTLPLFSRTTGEACAHCHLASSQLTPAGVAFAIDGNRSPADTVKEARRPPVSAVASAGASEMREVSTPPGSGTSDRDVISNRAAELHAQLRFGDLASVRIQANAGQPPSLRERDVCYAQLGALGAGRSFNARVGRFDAALPLLSNRQSATIHPYLAPVDLDALGLGLQARSGRWSGGLGWIDSRQDLHADGDAPLALRRMNDSYLWASRGGNRGVVQASFLFDRQNSTLPSLTWMQHLKLMSGAAFSLSRLTVMPGYVFDRYDDRPSAGVHEHHQYFLLEALAPFGGHPRWLLTGRYEHDYRTRTVLTPEADRQLAVANLNCEVFSGTSVALEGSDARDNVGGPDRRSVNARIRLVY